MPTLYQSLAIFAAVLGLAVTAAAFFTAWYLFKSYKEKVATESSAFDPSKLLRWTVLDYAVIGLFAVGMMFLLVDVLGMARDRGSYPLYHFGYLLSGFIFSFLGMLFTVGRLFLVLRLAGAPRPSAVHHHNEPNQAHQAEQGI